MSAGTLSNWWRARDSRERRMLAIMLCALAAFGYWYGLLAPARWLLQRSQLQHVEATRSNQTLQALATQVTARQAAWPDTQALEQRLQENARRRGIDINQIRTSAGGELEIELDQVPAATLLAWLRDLQEAGTPVPASMQLEKHDGGLQVHLRFARGQTR